MIKLLVLVVLVSLASACATSYAPNSFWNDGGFTETEVQPGIFQVRFKGNEFTSEERASDFAMLRSAELCLERDMQYIVMGDLTTVSRASGQIPGSATTTASASTYGNTAYGTSTATVTPPTTLYSPESGLTMACSTKQIEGSWDAAFLQKAMKDKYQID